MGGIQNDGGGWRPLLPLYHAMQVDVLHPLIDRLIPNPTPKSAGGNAGHSAALCGRVLGLPVRVIVPTTTKPLMLDKIRAQGAEVEVGA